MDSLNDFLRYQSKTSFFITLVVGVIATVIANRLLHGSFWAYAIGAGLGSLAGTLWISRTKKRTEAQAKDQPTSNG